MANNLNLQDNTINGVYMFDDWIKSKLSNHVKRHEILEIDEDLLALSSAWKRLRVAHANGGSYTPISSLLDINLLDHIIGDDRDKAELIRDYYSKKIMMLKLKSMPLSNYREDLNTFIHTNGKIFKDSMLPLAYRLPEFYEYDTTLDTLRSEHNNVIKDQTKIQEIKTLTLKKTFIINKKHFKRKEYWFSDVNNNLVTFSLSHDNPLISLLDIQCKNPIELSGQYKKYSREGNDHFVVEKYSFL